MPVKHYRELIAWQLAMELVVSTYQATEAVPDTERYGLVAQMWRAAVSVPSNIAEGQARRSTADFIRYLLMAHGSLAELETQVLLCERLHLVPGDTIRPLLASYLEVGRVLNGLIASLRPE